MVHLSIHHLRHTSRLETPGTSTEWLFPSDSIAWTLSDISANLFFQLFSFVDTVVKSGGWCCSCFFILASNSRKGGAWVVHLFLFISDTRVNQITAAISLFGCYIGIVGGG